MGRFHTGKQHRILRPYKFRFSASIMVLYRFIKAPLLLIVLIRHALHFVSCSTHANRIYDSDIALTDFGFACQPNVPNDELASIWNVASVSRCALYCNDEVACRFFDYDASSKMCRIFKDAVIVGTTSTTSRVGSVDTHLSRFSSYGELCTTSNCNTNRYLSCNAANRCQCQPGFFWYEQNCVGE
jgi:hypothetical protein